jgi:hypothetical protein
MPNIPELAKPEIFNQTTWGGRITCRQMHLKVTHSCLPLVGWTTESQYEDALNVVEKKNAVIRLAADRAVKKHPNLDVVYTDVLFRTPLDIKYMANDCFHPNRLGQANMAAILWNEQPWFRGGATQPNGSAPTSANDSDDVHVNHAADGIAEFQKQ